MRKDSKKNKGSVDEKDFIVFLPADELTSSGRFLKPVEDIPATTQSTLTSSTTLDEMPPAFRELAQPKLPELRHENRARLQMQSPNRLYFYWSIGTNPFQK